MSEKPKAVLTPTGRIVVSGPGLAELIKDIKQVELWHSPVNKGLALHFLDQASNVSKPIARGASGDEIWIEAGGYLDKIGFDRPETETELTAVVVDYDRKVITLRLGEPEDRPAPGLDYQGLED